MVTGTMWRKSYIPDFSELLGATGESTSALKQPERGPANLRSTSLKVAASEKAERKEVEKKKKKKKVKHRRSLWWTKRKEQFSSLFVSERKEEDVKEKGRKRNKSPRTKQFLERS